MLCGIYTRVSTNNQVFDGESLDEQEQKLINYCKLKNWEIIKVYREEGVSAKNLDRPKFKELIRDIEKGLIDTVVIKKIDRLSRSILDFEKTYNFFEKSKINLVSLQENFDTSTAIGRAIIRTVMVFAQLEREQTAERTLDVMEYRAQQGLWNGGYPPLGYDYDKEKNELIINSVESEIVRLIFEKYLELGSCMGTANYINKLNHRNKIFVNRKNGKVGGNQFIDTTINGILKNQIYTGNIKYKDKIYQGKHKSIISKELFEKVQNLLNHNRRKNSNYKKVGNHSFLLDKLVKCGYCGSFMAPRWATSKSRRYFYYECTSVGHSGKEACEVRQISAPALEEVIIERISQISQNELLLYKILSNKNEKTEKEIKDLEADKIILKLRVAELKKQIKKLLNKFIDNRDETLNKLLTEELKELETQKAELEKEIETKSILIEDLNHYVINAQLVKDTFKYFNEVYEKLSNIEKKNLISLMIRDIEFTKNRVKVEFFEVPEVELIMKKGSAFSFAEPLTLLREDKATRKFEDAFVINTIHQRYGRIKINIQ